MIRDVLELEGINIEKAHRVANKSNERNAPRTIVAKDKQAILSVAKKLKGVYILKRNIGNKKRKLADCEKVKKSGYVCLFSI